MEKVINLGQGIDGLFIQNDRFNSTLLSFHFFVPLNAQTIEKNALLPFLLSSSTDKFKDYTELNIRLLELYGGILSASVNKSGDNLHIVISLNLINNDLTFEKEDIITEGANLLFSMVFKPSLDGEAFCEKDVVREKRQTTERIEGEINNKRAFARSRLLSEMFGSDPYGLFVYGKAENVEKITAKDLYSSWKDLLCSAYVRLHIVGKSLPDGIFENLKSGFSNIKRENVLSITKAALLPESEKVNVVTEHYAVTQGKICLGYTCSDNGGGEKALPHLVFSDILGGGAYSKLFRNVREKQSLCYYCSASSVRQKGFMVVSSGIDDKNADKVIKAVLKELSAVQKGEFEDFALNASKKSITDSLNAYYDSSVALDAWYGTNLSKEEILTPKAAIEAINKISKEEIINAAKGLKLHTVYKLLSQEGNS